MHSGSQAVEGQDPGIAAGWQKAVHRCSGSNASYASYGSFAAQFSDAFRCLQVLFSFHVRFQGAASVPCAYTRKGCNSATNASAALCLHKTSDRHGRKNAQGKRIALPVDLPFRHVRFPSLGVANHNGMHHPIQAIDVNSMMQQDRMHKYAQYGETY